MSDIDDYIGTEEASARAGIDRGHLRRLCIAGKVDGARKVGRDWRIPRTWPMTYQRDSRGRKGKQ